MAKHHNLLMADYVLSGGHEEKSCLNLAKEFKENDPSINKSQLRKLMQEHVFYVAYSARYGRGEAGKKLTEMMEDL